MVTKVAAASGLAFVFVYILADIWGTQNWAYHDQVTYHLPFVNRLVEAGLDPFTDGTTATTPGAHLLYAAASVIFSAAPLEQNSPLIVVLGWLVAASTVGALLSCLLRLSGGWVWTPVLLIAVLSSQYFLLPAAYFVTDGLSFHFLALFFSLVAGGALHNSRLIAGAFARGALVLTRQIYLPMATAMAVIAFANPQWKNLQHPTILVPTVIAIALPAIAFLPFYLAWGGVLLPGFEDHGVADTNFAAAAQSIALLGFFGVPVLYPMLSGARQTQILVGVGVALVALALVFTFSQTSFSFEEGRWGSIIWTLSQIEERTFGLPISVYLLSAVGAFLLTWASMEGSFTLRIAVIGYSVYSATLALQSYAWQRYSEVFALFIVSFVAARVLPERHGFHTVVFVVFYLIWLSITFIVRAEVQAPKFM